MKKRCYRFVYQNICIYPKKQEAIKDSEGVYYVRLTEIEMILGNHSTSETGFITLAVENFYREMGDPSISDEIIYHELKRIEVVTYYDIDSEGECVRKALEEYDTKADSMTDILVSMIKDGTVFTNEQLMYCIKHAGDDNYVSPDDIREMCRE